MTSSLFFLLLLLLLHSFLTSHSALLMQTCTTPVSVDDACRAAADVSYDYCVSSLSADPRSRGADLHGLAVLATKLAIDHLASTESKVEELTELEETPEIKEGFDACLEVYSKAVEGLRDALDNLNARLYEKAAEQLGKAAGASEECEEAFRGKAAAPPGMVEDREYGKLARIAMGIAAAVE